MTLGFGYATHVEQQGKPGQTYGIRNPSSAEMDNDLPPGQPGYPPGSNPPGSSRPSLNPSGSNAPGSSQPGLIPPSSSQPVLNPPNPPGSNPPGSNPPGSNPPGLNPPTSNPPNPPGSNPPSLVPPGSNPPNVQDAQQLDSSTTDITRVEDPDPIDNGSLLGANGRPITGRAPPNGYLPNGITPIPTTHPGNGATGNADTPQPQPTVNPTSKRSRVKKFFAGFNRSWRETMQRIRDKLRREPAPISQMMPPVDLPTRQAPITA